MPSQFWWILVAVVIVAVIATGWTALTRRRASARYGALTGGRRRRRPHRDTFRSEPEEEPGPPRKRAAFIVNPTKIPDLADLRARLQRGCAEHGWADALVLETTEYDSGAGQAKVAAFADVDVIVAIGGDGTARAIAGALAGSETPMAIVPLGTTNLLARNLDLPVDSLDALLKVALTGHNRRIDVGILTLDVSGEDEHPVEHPFLVMAGLGMDGEVMAETSERLKAHVGWPAYVLNGAGKILKRGFKARIKLDMEQEFVRRTRSVLVGNCGRLTGGIVLMPDAKVDDGFLDAAIISPRGPLGWSGVVAQAVTKRHYGHARVEISQCTEIKVRVDQPTEVQVDGDHLGPARAVAMRIQPRALSVRVPGSD